MVTTKVVGEVTQTVHLDGVTIGDIVDLGGRWLAYPTGAGFATYRFADRDAAIAACVSYAAKGYWTGEVAA